MGWFHDTFGFSSQDITDPIMETVQSVIDPVKDTVGESGIGSILGALAALGFAPATGGATLSLLPYMAAGGGMIGGGMEDEGNTLMNILTGGLGGYGLGSMGSSLLGTDVASIFGGGGGIGDILGKLFGSGQQGGGWQQGTTPTGTPYWFDNQGNISWTQPAGGGGGNILTNLLQRLGLGGGQQTGQQGGLDLGSILSTLGGGGTTGTGGTTGSSIADYSAYAPMPERLSSLFEQYRQLPEYQQYQDIFNQGISGLDQLSNIGPDYFKQFELAPTTPINKSFFEQFGPTSLEQAVADQYFKYAAPEAERAIAHRMSLSGMGESPVTAELIGKSTGKLGVDIGQYLSNLAQQRAVQALQDRFNLQNIGEQRGARSLAGLTTASTQKTGFDPATFALNFASRDIPLQTGANTAQQYNEQLRNAQSQAKTSSISSLIGSAGESLLGIPGLSNIVNTLSPLWGGSGGNFNIGNILSAFQPKASTNQNNNVSNLLSQFFTNKLFNVQTA